MQNSNTDKCIGVATLPWINTERIKHLYTIQALILMQSIISSNKASLYKQKSGTVNTLNRSWWISNSYWSLYHHSHTKAFEDVPTLETN